MTTEGLVLILIIVLIAGVLPTWPYSRAWGYRPMSILVTLLVVILLFCVLSGRPFMTQGQSLKHDVRSAGEDIKDMGRDAADSIRKTVQ